MVDGVLKRREMDGANVTNNLKEAAAAAVVVVARGGGGGAEGQG